MSPLELFIKRWAGRWQTEQPGCGPAVAITESMSRRASPAQVIGDLIARGEYWKADDLLAGPLSPALADDEREALAAALAEAQRHARLRTIQLLEELETRARLAGQSLAIDREALVELAEGSAVLARDTIRDEVETKVSQIEGALRDDLLWRLGSAPHRARIRHRVERCLQLRQWDVANRLITRAEPSVLVAARQPADFPQPPDLATVGPPIVLATQWLEYPEWTQESYGWPQPDDAVRQLLRAILDIDGSPSTVARALAGVIGDPADYQEHDGRVQLHATSLLPVPRPKFVGEDGLELALDAEAADSATATLDLGQGVPAGIPRIGVRDLLSIAMTDGDRRIALVRLVGRQLPARLLLPDLAASPNLESGVDWALDFASPYVLSPLVEILIATASSRPSLAEVLYCALVPSPDMRQGGLSTEHLSQALLLPTTSDALEQAFRNDLAGDPNALDVLIVADALGGTIAGQTVDALSQEAVVAVEIFCEAEGLAPRQPEDVRRAVNTLYQKGYVRERRDGSHEFELGTVRELDLRVAASDVG